MCNQNGLIEKLNQESINYCKILTQQNYIQYKGSQYIQEKGLAMSTPMLSIFLEMYLQYLENTQVFNILLKHQIVGYFRYGNDILTVYQCNTTNIHKVVSHLTIGHL
jgi:hypothetical protein